MTMDNLTSTALAHFKKIEHQLKELESLLRQADIVHASVAKLPIAEVDEQGHDTVFDDISEIVCERYYGQDALAKYFESIQFQNKTMDYSNRAGRRTAGIVHVNGSEALLESIKDSVLTINASKEKLVVTVNGALGTYYERSKFYQANFHGLLMKSVTRYIPLINQPVQRIGFSWVEKGYSEVAITRKQAEDIIRRRIESKLNSNPDLTFESLWTMDMARLEGSNADCLYLMLPNKLNPTATVVFKGAKPTTYRACIPLLILGGDPLGSYRELNDYLGVVRKVKGVKRSERVPVILEYGIYTKAMTEANCE